MTTEPSVITDNLEQLLDVLPEALRAPLDTEHRAGLVEVVLDLGRRPEARYAHSFNYISEDLVTHDDLAYVESRLGAFGDDNRAGIPATLHRISALRNRRGTVVGLTLRVGRAVTGIVDILRDVIESGESILLMGRPGLGKTTLLREMARVLADELCKRVVIVDTSNEIAGDGDVPHPAIGRARRMQVARVQQQHDVMIEAVENHMPEVVVIDEIGRIEETTAARTIAERAVQLIATVHGNTLDNLLANPTLSDLIGGIGAVTLSDEEARRRGTQKTVLERKAPPTFNVVVEMIERDKLAVRRPVASVVDDSLRGLQVPPEIRWRDENGQVHVEQPAPTPASSPSRFEEPRPPTGRQRFAANHGGRGGSPRGGGRPGARSESGRREAPHTGSLRPAANGSAFAWDTPARPPRLLPASSEVELHTEPDEASEAWQELPAADEATLPGVSADFLVDGPIDVSKIRRVYPFGISRSRLGRAIKHLGLPLTIARTWHDADAVVMLCGSGGLPAQSSLLQEARDLKLPTIGVRGNTYAQIASRLNDLYNAQLSEGQGSARDLAMQEARSAAQRVMAQAEPVELRPQIKTLRRVQHQLAERYHLRSYSVGRDPNRRVRFLPQIAR